MKSKKSMIDGVFGILDSSIIRYLDVFLMLAMIYFSITDFIEGNYIWAVVFFLLAAFNGYTIYKRPSDKLKSMFVKTE